MLDEANLVISKVDKVGGCHARGVCYNAQRMKLLSLSALALAALVPMAGAQQQGGDRPAPARKAKAGKSVVNRIAATVNGRPITSSEVRARLSPYMHELMILYPQQGPRFDAELVKAKKQVLSELIDRELVLSEFENKGFMMPENQVDEEINRRILMQHNGKREEFLDGLRKSGLTISEYRDSVKKEITVASMRSSRYERDIPPTPDEIRAEYNASKADYRDVRQDSIRYEKIFIPAVVEEDPTVTWQDQLELAKEIRRKIDMGDMSFAEAAREYSRDMYAEQGGKWPAIKRQDLAVEFANVVFSLPEGKIMGPLMDQGGAGFTIVRVLDIKLAPAPPLSRKEVKDQVDDAVRRKQSEKRYREWVDRLRDRAVIRTFI